MASRADLARLVGQFKGVAPALFRDYVKTLEGRRDDTIHKLLYATADVEVLRGEARAYDALLNDILKNENPS